MKRTPSSTAAIAWVVLFASTLVWLVAGGPVRTSAQGPEVTVDIKDFAFLPREVTVSAGTRVVWTNQDSAPHTATSDAGVWDSGTLHKDQRFGFTFQTPGQYRYICAFHPWMEASITVTQPAVRLAPPTPVSPADGERLGTFGPTLTWSQPQGTTQFQVQVLPAPNPFTGQPDGPAIDLIIGEPGRVAAARFVVPEPSFGTGPYLMLPDMTYRWRVRVTNAPSSVGPDDPSWSDWSPERSFRTRAASAATLRLIAPPQDGTAGPLPTLQWDDTDTGVFYYEVQLSADAQFRTGADAVAAVYWNLVHGGESVPSRSWTVPAGFELQPGHYFWRVRPRVQGDGSPVAWGPAWSFTR
ncbi:MAG: cupredoxin family copper-binding protein [Chloroflexi bacterium]|nr:cupredoxin family copper-binding protein [Chloroflexota bacterium]